MAVMLQRYTEFDVHRRCALCLSCNW